MADLASLDGSTNGGATALQRLSNLQQNYTWVPFQTMYGLVNSGLSDSEITQSLTRLTSAAVSSDQATTIAKSKATTTGLQKGIADATTPTPNFSFKQFFDDPVLQKAPSAGMAIKQYLSGAVGSWPVADTDLAHQQQQLQLRGYGQGLPTDGKWDASWDAAYRQYSDYLYNSHVSGGTTGSASLKQVMQSLAALQPVGAFNAIYGFFKSMPGDMRDLLGDAARTLAMTNAATAPPSVDLHGDITRGPDASHALQRTPAEFQANVKNLLGADTTAQQEAERLRNPLGVIVQDLSTIFMLTGMYGAGSRFASAIGEESALAGTEAGAKLSAQEAMKGPGVIARTLGAPGLTTSELSYGTIRGTRIARGLAGGVLGGGAVTATGSDNPSEVLAGIAGGALIGAVSVPGKGFTKAFTNLPVLGNTGPEIASLASGDGLYYKARNLLATPYKYAPVRIAGKAFQDVTMLGAQARGLAALQSGPIGATNSFTQGVQQEHTFDTVNDAIKHRLDFTVLGMHIAPSLDDLQFFLHGPTETWIRGTGELDDAGNIINRVKVPEAKMSSVIGDNVSRMLDAYSTALGDPGFSAAVTRITGKSLAHNIRDAGGVANYNEFWGDKLAFHASGMAAEQARNDELANAGLALQEGFSNPERLADLAKKFAEVRSDPARLSDAIRTLRAQGNGGGLDQWIQRVRREIAHNMAGPKASEYNNIPQYMEAMRLARTEIYPKLLNTVDEFTSYSPARLPGETPPPVTDEIARLKGQQSFLTKGFRKNKNVFSDPEAVIPPGGLALPNADQQSLALTATRARRIFQNGDEDPGKMGLAKTSQLVQQEAHTQIDALEAAYPRATEQLVPGVGGGIPLADVNAWNTQMDDFLYHNFGIDGARIPEQGLEKIQVAREAAKHLAVEIRVHPDAPPEIAATVQRIRDLGYRPVSGTNIGHIITGPTPIDMMEGPLTYTRRLAERLGLGPNLTTGSSLASYRTTEAINAMDDVLRSGKARLNSPNIDANTILATVEGDRGRIQAGKAPFFDRSSVLKDTARTLFRTAKRQAKARGIDQLQVEHELQQGLGGFTDLTRKQWVEAWTDPSKTSEYFPSLVAAANAADKRTPEEIARDLHVFGTPDAPIMDETSANALYAAYRDGYYSPRGYMLGAERIEELSRNVLGFMGDVGTKVGAPNLGFAIANMPHRLIQLRNDLRFDLDPWFSLKRIMKTNAKLGAEGIPWTVNPLKVMNARGTRPEDIQYFEYLFPTAGDVIYDEGARYLHSQDVFGLYNPHDYASMAAGEWKRQGFSDDEIKDKIIHVFEYGKDGVSGRSPLERTMNFFFFPFSFEKTVMRNLGGYLLDHPAQRILLTNAMAAYDDFNQNHADNPLSTEFMKVHAPILNEAANLNMFAHGIGIGQPGGINRPLLNLFLPQSWDPAHPDIVAKLKGFIPAVKNFQRLYQEVTQQQSIMTSTMSNMYQDLKGTTQTFGAGGQWNSAGPRQTTLTKSAQLTQAFTMQREWYQNYQAVLDHNAKTQDSTQKIRFEMDPKWGKYAGEPITKNLIRKIIEGYYPAYSANAAVAAATTTASNFQDYLLNTKGAPLHDYVQSFATNAHNLATGMTSNRFTAQDVINYTAGLRAQAVYIAGQDPAFYKLYAKNFSRLLGPLEKVA